MIAKKIEIIVPIHNKFPTNPSQARCIKAALKSEINNLSPLVVSKPKTPLLGVPPGTLFSHITIQNIQIAIKTKNAAVCHVHAIQVINSKSKKPFSYESIKRPVLLNINVSLFCFLNFLQKSSCLLSCQTIAL